MSILIDRNTRLIVQGITGRDGAFHALFKPDDGPVALIGGPCQEARGNQGIEVHAQFRLAEKRQLQAAGVEGGLSRRQQGGRPVGLGEIEQDGDRFAEPDARLVFKIGHRAQRIEGAIGRRRRKRMVLNAIGEPHLLTQPGDAQTTRAARKIVNLEHCD